MTAREPAIARRAAQWLEAQGLEVYTEVQAQERGRIADLVGAGSQALVVVETKVSLGLELIEQAQYWQRFSNAVWCAFADIRRKDRYGYETIPRTRALALSVCEWLGLGVLAIPEEEQREPVPLVHARVTETKPVHDFLREALIPQRRLGAGYAEAGSKGGGHFTTFKGTAEVVAQVVAEHPEGIEVKAIEAEVRERGGHHYRTEKSFCTQILKLVKLGKIPGVKVSKAAKAFGRKASVLVPTTQEE